MTTIFNPPLGSGINSSIIGDETISGFNLSIQYYNSITVIGSLTVPREIDLYAGSYIYLAGGTVNATNIWGTGPVSNGIQPLGGVIQGYGTINASLNGGAGVGVNAQGGLLKISGILPSSAGNGGQGYYEVQNGASLELNSPTAYIGNLIYAGNNGFIKLDTPAQFQGTIIGMEIGDTLDLGGVSATSVTYNNNSVLTINESNGQILNYSFNAQTLSTNGTSVVTAFPIATPDGSGGTNITWSTSAYPSSGSIAAFLGVASNLGPFSFSITDTSVSIASFIDSLELNLNKISGITQSDMSAMISISMSQFANDAGVLSDIQGPYLLKVSGVSASSIGAVISNTHVNTIEVSDTAVNLSSSLSTIQAAIGKISRITVSDNQILHVTASEVVGDSGVLNLITASGGSYSQIASNGSVSTFFNELSLYGLGQSSFTIQDSSANVGLWLNTLQVDLSAISSLTLTDSSPIGISYAQLTADSGVLSAITTPYTLSIQNASVTQALGAVTNTHVSTISIYDSIANIAQNIDALEKINSEISNVILTNPSGANILLITSSQESYDAAILGKIIGSYTVELINSNPAHSVILTNSNQTYQITNPNLSITGTNGIDVVALTESSNNFNVSLSSSTATLTDNSGVLGVDTLASIERLQFTDTNIALDIGPTQTAGSVYMLYQATFNRTPDAAGLGYWIAQVDKGANIITNVAASFIQSPEFVAKYGSNSSNASYVDNLYQNVLHRAGESGGVAYWNQQLNTGAATKAFVLEQFATLAEGAALVAPAIAHGIAYQQWVG